jgi:hypothetical protein
MPLAGGPIVHIASAEGYPIGFAIDAARIYWTSADKILSAPLSGGTPTTHASGQYQPGAVAVDATNLHWMNQGLGGGIVTVPLSGGTPMTLASDPSASSWGLVVDAKYVYRAGAGLNRIAK